MLVSTYFCDPGRSLDGLEGEWLARVPVLEAWLLRTLADARRSLHQSRAEGGNRAAAAHCSVRTSQFLNFHIGVQETRYHSRQKSYDMVVTKS